MICKICFILLIQRFDHMWQNEFYLSRWSVNYENLNVKKKMQLVYEQGPYNWIMIIDYVDGSINKIQSYFQGKTILLAY